MQYRFSSPKTATLLCLITVPVTWTVSGCSSTRVADANNGSASAAHDASTPLTATDAGHAAPSTASPCAKIDTECRSYDDKDGLGRLCLEAAQAKDTAQCEALADDCAAWCQPNGTLPAAPSDGTTLSLELCDETLGDRCHPLDNGAGLAHLCHEVGHAGNLVWCGALYDECTALCGAEETEHDAGLDAGDAAP